MKHQPRLDALALKTVFAARERLKQGLSLQDVATALHVQKSDLDFSFWYWIHVESPQENASQGH